MEEQTKSSKGKWYLILFIIILVGAGYSYYYVTSTAKLRTEAQSVVAKAQSYDALRERIQAETDRCKTFITQSEGDFGSFEYCKKFIEWSK